jgi:zinc transport system permease protein
MLDDFLVRAVLGGVGVALAAGPVGSFVVWRRMAYFGEALANAALLGTAVALVLEVNLIAGVLAFVALTAVLLTGLERRLSLPPDTLLSILAHGALAIGLLVLSWRDGLRIDLFGYLLGDVLAIARADLLVIAAMLASVLLAVAICWRPLLSATVHADLAEVEGVPVARMRLLTTLLVAGIIAVGMKIVGILLIISLLVVPAAAARQLARTPEAMALGASLIGAAAVLAGLYGSYAFDLPAGPAIVAAAVGLFALMALIGGLARRRLGW